MFIALLLAAAPVFDPMRFFAGATCREGRLKVMLRAHAPVAVRGSGHVEPDGVLVLDQVVMEGKSQSVPGNGASTRQVTAATRGR